MCVPCSDRHGSCQSREHYAVIAGRSGVPEPRARVAASKMSQQFLLGGKYLPDTRHADERSITGGNRHRGRSSRSPPNPIELPTRAATRRTSRCHHDGILWSRSNDWIFPERVPDDVRPAMPAGLPGGLVVAGRIRSGRPEPWFDGPEWRSADRYSCNFPRPVRFRRGHVWPGRVGSGCRAARARHPG